MNVLTILSIILLLLMAWVGGKKGVRSFFALFFNFGVLFFTVVLMTDSSFNPIILTVVGSTFISGITLFYVNEVNVKTKAAFVATMIIIVLLLGFIILATRRAGIQGFSEEEMLEISMLSIYIGVDFVRVGVAVIIMATIGAITDVAISIASAVYEIFQHNPSMSKRELYSSGLMIGRDILGTNTNTLFFAFFGGYFALLVWFKVLEYSFWDIVNSKAFSGEMMSIFFAGIAVALVIPITSWVSAWFFVRESGEKGVTSE